jgi:hypothetical protein
MLDQPPQAIADSFTGRIAIRKTRINVIEIACVSGSQPAPTIRQDSPPSASTPGPLAN